MFINDSFVCCRVAILKSSDKVVAWIPYRPMAIPFRRSVFRDKTVEITNLTLSNSKYEFSKIDSIPVG